MALGGAGAWGRLVAIAVAFVMISPAHAQGMPERMPTSIPETVPTATPIATRAATPVGSPATVVPPLDVVRAAFDLLRQRYVTAVSPEGLLSAARRGDGSINPLDLASVPPSADLEASWQAFAADFDDIAGAMPPGGNPAHVAVRRMTASLDDCHTSFTADHARDAAALMRAEPYGGIGAVIREARRFDPPPPGPVVVHVFESSPAAKSGLRAGDSVIAVDDVASMSLPGLLTERVRGAPGSTVRLRVDRPGVPAPFDIPIERGAVTVPLVAYRRVDVVGVGPVGVVRLRSFAQPSVAPMIEAITELRGQAVRGWVLDLRENGGGDLGVFERVASLFLSGPLAVTVERDGAPRTMMSRSPRLSDHPESLDRLPVALLVNGETASAAELLAGDFGDYGFGRLFGERTAGCFGTSRLFRLPDGSGMWITVSALQTGVARRDVHRIGFSPAIPVVLRRADLAAGRDSVVEASLAWLQERLSVTDGDPRLVAVR